jgi:hypothetical protein
MEAPPTFVALNDMTDADFMASLAWKEPLTADDLDINPILPECDLYPPPIKVETPGTCSTRGSQQRWTENHRCNPKGHRARRQATPLQALPRFEFCDDLKLETNRMSLIYDSVVSVPESDNTSRIAFVAAQHFDSNEDRHLFVRLANILMDRFTSAPRKGGTYNHADAMSGRELARSVPGLYRDTKFFRLFYYTADRFDFSVPETSLGGGIYLFPGVTYVDTIVPKKYLPWTISSYTVAELGAFYCMGSYVSAMAIDQSRTTSHSMRHVPASRVHELTPVLHDQYGNLFIPTTSESRQFQFIATIRPPNRKTPSDDHQWAKNAERIAPSLHRFGPEELNTTENALSQFGTTPDNLCCGLFNLTLSPGLHVHLPPTLTGPVDLTSVTACMFPWSISAPLTRRSKSTESLLSNPLYHAMQQRFRVGEYRRVPLAEYQNTFTYSNTSRFPSTGSRLAHLLPITLINVVPELDAFVATCSDTNTSRKRSIDAFDKVDASPRLIKSPTSMDIRLFPQMAAHQGDMHGAVAAATIIRNIRYACADRDLDIQGPVLNAIKFCFESKYDNVLRSRNNRVGETLVEMQDLLNMDVISACCKSQVLLRPFVSDTIRHTIVTLISKSV